MTVTGPWFALRALPIIALVVPSALVIAGPLQSNGWPGRLVVFWVAGALFLGWVRRPGLHRRPSPAEAGSWLLVLGLAAAFAAVHLRVVTEEEAAGAVRAALVMFPLAVVAIGTATMVGARGSDVLLVGILVGACFSATLALAQAVSPFDPAELLQVPGTVSRDVGGMGDRAGFLRVKGSAAHPIEFGVICGAVVPLAVHFARFADTSRRRATAAIAAGVLVLAVPLSVSRSGIVTVIVAMAIYAVVLSTRQRLSALVIAIVGLILFRAAIPGLLGTVLGFFLGASQDSSVTARTEDYAVIDALFAEKPILGRGLGTFRPDEYFFLDNQYLMSLVEGGLVLTTATIAFFLLALASTRGAAMRASTPTDASRAQAVAAAIGSIGLSGAFFDLFSFAQVTVVVFILVGVAGALWHHAQVHGMEIPSPSERVRGARVGTMREGAAPSREGNQRRGGESRWTPPVPEAARPEPQIAPPHPAAPIRSDRG